MSAVRNAPKKWLPKIIKKPIRERGRLRNEENPEMISFSETPPVPAVKHRLEYRTIQMSKSMAGRNTLNSREQLPSVILAIEVCIPEGSDARNVVKLGLIPAVNSAMVACLDVIENELFTGRSTDNESGTKSNLIKINLHTDGKKNTKRFLNAMKEKFKE